MGGGINHAFQTRQSFLKQSRDDRPSFCIDWDDESQHLTQLCDWKRQKDKLWAGSYD